MPRGYMANAMVAIKAHDKRKRQAQEAKESKAREKEEAEKRMLETSPFSPKQFKKYREMFNLYDTDKSGTITVSEVRKVLRNSGMNTDPEAVNEVFQEMDVDSSGSIDFEEFLTVMSRVLADEDTEEDMVMIFRILDQDGDGFITKSDLRECCVRVGSHLTPHDLDEMMTEADKDGDGQITYEEFLKILEARS